MRRVLWRGEEGGLIQSIDQSLIDWLVGILEFSWKRRKDSLQLVGFSLASDRYGNPVPNVASASSVLGIFYRDSWLKGGLGGFRLMGMRVRREEGSLS